MSQIWATVKEAIHGGRRDYTEGSLYLLRQGR